MATASGGVARALQRLSKVGLPAFCQQRDALAAASAGLLLRLTILGVDVDQAVAIEILRLSLEHFAGKRAAGRLAGCDQIVEGAQ